MKLLKKVKLNLIFSGLQSISTFALLIWGIFFSPLSDFKQLENETKTKQLKAAQLTKNKLDAEIANLIHEKNSHKKYLNYLFEMSCNKFIQDLQKDFDELKSIQSNIESISEFNFYKTIEKDYDINLKALRDEQKKCWTDKCAYKIEAKINKEIKANIDSMPESALRLKMLKYTINNDKSINQTIKEWNDTANLIIEKKNNNLFSLIKKRLDTEDFELILPERKNHLRNVVWNFISINVKEFSIPLVAKLFDDWKEQDVNNEIRKMQNNHIKAQEKIIELKNIMLSS